jgi:hypothetical protein
MFEYGRHLGLAFQVVDDILDFTTPEEQLGKPQVSHPHRVAYPITGLGVERNRRLQRLLECDLDMRRLRGRPCASSSGRGLSGSDLMAPAMSALALVDIVH